MNFDKLIEKILLEMPHVASDDTDSNKFEFDFEVETYSPTEEGYKHLVTTVRNFLNGDSCPARRGDRTGISYSLSNDSRSSFIESLKANNILDLMLKKRFNKSLDIFVADLNLN
jgi:hypothetical protein